MELQEKWLIHLSASEIGNIRDAVSAAVATNKSLSALTANDFPLGELARNVSAWQHSLSPEVGLGVIVLRGLPIHTWSTHEQEILWWGLGMHIGIPGAQNGNGDLLGRVSNEFFLVDDAKSLEVGNVRQYRTSEKIEFHCDPADVVGLLCLHTAGKGGGRSRLASSVTVFNEMQKKHPDLIARLFQPLALDSRGDSGMNWFPMTPCTYSRGVLRTFWHTEYMRTAYRYPDSPYPNIPSDVASLISTYDAIANDPDIYLEMDFREGDVQLISNHVVRYEYVLFLQRFRSYFIVLLIDIIGDSFSNRIF